MWCVLVKDEGSGLSQAPLLCTENVVFACIENVVCVCEQRMWCVFVCMENVFVYKENLCHVFVCALRVYVTF